MNFCYVQFGTSLLHINGTLFLDVFANHGTF